MPRPMSKDLHLPPNYHEQVVSILRRNAPEIEVWAYGSRVDGSSHDTSDLDLILRAPGALVLYPGCTMRSPNRTYP